MSLPRSFLGFLTLGALMACRGQPSELPPVHLNPNMDSQEKYDAQSERK